jgi:hypothetical protein
MNLLVNISIYVHTAILAQMSSAQDPSKSLADSSTPYTFTLLGASVNILSI